MNTNQPTTPRLQAIVHDSADPELDRYQVLTDLNSLLSDYRQLLRGALIFRSADNNLPEGQPKTLSIAHHDNEIAILTHEIAIAEALTKKVRRQIRKMLRAVRKITIATDEDEDYNSQGDYGSHTDYYTLD